MTFTFKSLTLPSMKVCSHCKAGETDTVFYPYNKWVCKNCLAVQNKKKYEAKKHTAEYKEKHAKYNLAHYHKNKDAYNKRAKKYRESDNGKKKRKEYILKNKDKIMQQESVVKRKYHDKNKDSVSDRYALNLLKTQGNKNPGKEEIEIKKAKVLLSRIKKKIHEQSKKHG